MPILQPRNDYYGGEVSPAEVLEGAADLIDERGHCKETLRKYTGEMCAQGAILCAYRGVADWPAGMPMKDMVEAVKFLQAEHPLLVAALVPLQRANGEYTSRWNNAPERTQDEVTSTLRAVAMSLRAQEQSAPSLIEEREHATA
jgi:hypothetical protein